ncbi:T9SS type A sorting domain-containing protein [Rufibacter aurantiacus]|uniref:T9SS type A sorting domain-containing protein n=1 Tax=Rufibacter aurantiacus TaxID=2817374 RepID=UPI001B30589C|nr:T9SS type A sorting domain-containing protein [Rufibacter aurantiacus]
MAQILRLLVFAFVFFPLTLFAEGSKQLTPNKSSSALTSPLNDKVGYLAHDANLPSASGVAITSLSFLKPAGFSRNGATYSKDHRLYIRVKAGETLYYGVHRAIHDQTSANQADLTITLRRTNAITGVDDANYSSSSVLRANTSSTRSMLLVANQNGVIDNATEAENGPNRPAIGGRTAVTNGYTPLSITNGTTEDYDYYVEFTQAGETSWTDDGRRFSVYDFWDFTVIDAAGTERQGRMRSKLWSFSAGGTANVFSKDFNLFPLIPSEDQTGKFFVKKIELAGIAPQNFFRFVTNSFGSNTTAGATASERRKSQTSQTDYPEYFNFVNDPDPAIWPSATAPTFSVSLASSCNTTTGGGKTLFNLNTTERSTFLVLINLDGTPGYQTNSADVLLESSGAKGTRSVEWNGLNGLGQPVAKNTTLNYSFRNGSMPVNFPVWDAEWNDGFRVMDVRPLAPGTTAGDYSLLYWDDTNLPTSSFPSRSELFGAVSSTGVHTWGSATTTAGDLKTVNTWTYGFTSSSQQSATFTYDCSADVAVTNLVSAGPYAIGKEFTYTVTVTNNGPLPATNVIVTDKLDASQLQFVSSSDAAYNSNTGAWNVGTLAVGASKTLTITAKPVALGTFSTTASQTHTEADNVTSNNSASASITVQPSADIAVSNSVPKTSYYNGELVTFTITAQNLGPNAATGVTITDKLPAGLVLQGSAPTGYDANSGVWTVGNLALNEIKTLTLTAKATQLGSLTTTATLDSRTNNEVDLNGSNNSASTTITVAPAADIAVTNMVSNSSPAQGETITYTIQAVNNGPNNATNVSLANQIPAGLTITGYNASSGTFDAASGTWTVGTIVTSGSQTLTITAKPNATGALTFSTTQSHTEFDTQSSNNTAASTINVSPAADVAVTNVISSPAKTTYANGDQVTYTVTVSNNGPSAATNVVVTDKLPASLSLVSANSSVGTGTYNAATGSWSVGTLANGASATLTLVAKVETSAVITTTASQTHTEFDNTNGNNSASNSITSGSGTITADIKITTGMSAGPYYTGKQLTLGVRVDNIGPDAATGVSVNALVPAGFTLVSATPRVGTYDATTGIWNLGNLAAGSFTGMNLVVVPNVDNTVTGNKDYTFTAAKRTENEFDDKPDNNTASTTFTVQKAADAAVSISVAGDVNGVYYKGVTEATFTLKVTNNGPDRITNLKGMDTRSGTINFTYAEPGKGYNPATGEWIIDALEPGQSVTLVVKGIPNTTGRMNLGGEIISADQKDLNPENNKAVALINVVPAVDLQVTNMVAAGPHYNGQNTTFTVAVKNNSTDAATGVKIEDVLPSGLAFVSATPSVGTYDATSGIWTLGTDLLAGSTQTLVLTVKPTSGSTYTSTASVKAVNEYESNTANNTATAQITVGKTADIVLGSSIAAGPYYVGGQYQVTITTTNAGPDLATGVAVSASGGTGLRPVVGSGKADIGTMYAQGVWTVGDLGVGETKTFTFLVEPLTTGTLNSLGYKSAQNEFDPNGGNTPNGNNSTVVSFNVEDRPAIAKVVNTDKHMFLFQTGDHIVEFTDPDGPIENARIVNGTLPAGTRLEQDGTLEVDYRFHLVPGTYTLTIETTDAQGDISLNTITYKISGDWDKDGIDDVNDLDDNNDGIITEPGAVNPTGDHDNDGTYNYLDRDFVHPTYGAFQDKNGDDIHDAFDLDLDGLIRGYDIDIDGDGIPNAVEANGGTAPAGYNSVTGTFTGDVNAQGIPLAILDKDGKNSLPNLDTDKDGFADFLDIDSDDDGILDMYEAQATLTFVNGLGTDSDYDGMKDGYDATTSGKAIVPVDTDRDGKPDYLDRDSDGDFTPDYVEAFDDNNDGVSMDDLLERARIFEEVNQKGWYINSDKDATGTPKWLASANGSPAYLTKGSAYYHDTDKDGLVDLFDTENGGRTASLQTTNGEYTYRSSSVVTPLPVTLTSFTAKAQKDGVSLAWTTAAEKDNDYFQVERSMDGRNFSAIGQVKGNGNSNVRVDYHFLDSKLLGGTAYYRLKQVDYDGKFEYSKTLAVQTKAVAATEVTMKAYPNPTADMVNLDLTSLSSSTVTISIYALDGRLVKTQQLEGGVVQTLDLAKFAVGTYLLKIKGAEVDVVTRVVKQ